MPLLAAIEPLMTMALLAAGEAQILSGGTDFYPALGDRVVRGPVVDVSGLGGLRGVSSEAGWFRIGGLTTWSEIIRTPLPRCFDALKSAARAELAWTVAMPPGWPVFHALSISSASAAS